MQKLTIIPRFEGGSAAQRAEALNKLKGVLTDLRCQSVSVSCHANGAYELVGENIHSYPREPKPAPKELTITVEGPTGSGKTVVIGEIMDMLAGRGVKCEYLDPSNYADHCRVVTSEPALKLKSTRLPRVETVQAVEMRVSCPEFNASVELAAMASTLLTLDPHVEIPESVLVMARRVMDGINAPLIDTTCDDDALARAVEGVC
jgi:hypothetical protein